MKKHKFTLIEIMGVVALIFILLAIGIGVYMYAMESSREKATRGTVARIENGFKTLQDKNMIPKTDAGSGTEYVKIKFDAANTAVTFYTADSSSQIALGNNADRKREIYQIFARAINADSIDGMLDNDKFLCDAWGHPLLIRFPGKFNRAGGFDIISPGSDGKFGVDAVDTPPVDISKYKDTDNDIICDDIANFL